MYTPQTTITLTTASKMWELTIALRLTNGKIIRLLRSFSDAVFNLEAQETQEDEV